MSTKPIQFRLTTTNPWFDPPRAESNSFDELMGIANRYAIGESNCSGCEHWYCITNVMTERSVFYHATDMIGFSRRSPWEGNPDGVGIRLKQDALVEAALALGCTVDELLYPLDD